MLIPSRRSGSPRGTALRVVPERPFARLPQDQVPEDARPSRPERAPSRPPDAGGDGAGDSFGDGARQDRRAFARFAIAADTLAATHAASRSIADGDVSDRPGGIGFADGVLAALDKMAAHSFGRIADPALRASAERGFGPARAAIEQQARAREAGLRREFARGIGTRMAEDADATMGLNKELGALALATLEGGLDALGLEADDREAVLTRLVEASDADTVRVLSAHPRLRGVIRRREAERTAQAEAEASAALPPNRDARGVPVEVETPLAGAVSGAALPKSIAAASTAVADTMREFGEAAIQRTGAAAVAASGLVSLVAAGILVGLTAPAGDVSQRTETLDDGTKVSVTLDGPAGTALFEMQDTEGQRFEYEFGVDGDGAFSLRRGRITDADGTGRELSPADLDQAIALTERTARELGLPITIGGDDGGGKGDEAEETPGGASGSLTATGSGDTPSLPPEDPDDDPLARAALQMITGQLVGRLARNQTRLNFMASDVANEVRELYPDGIDDAELERFIALSTEWNNTMVRPLEGSTAILLERQEGLSLERFNDSARIDFVGPGGVKYDAVRGNMDAEFFNLPDAQRSIRDHLKKSDVDVVVVDLHRLLKEDARAVIEYLRNEYPEMSSDRLIILE